MKKYYVLIFLFLINLGCIAQILSSELYYDTVTFNRNIKLDRNTNLGMYSESRVVLFIAPSKDEGSVSNFQLEITIPDNVEIYNNKYLDGNKTKSGIFPFGKVHKLYKHKIIYKYPKYSELNWKDVGNFYLFLIPNQIGKGQIKAKFSWYGEDGKYFENEIEGGEVVVEEAPDIVWEICKQGNLYKIKGQYLYNHDYESYISEDADINLSLINGSNKFKLKSIILPSNFNSDLSSSLSGTVKLGNTVWDVNQTNIRFEDCTSIDFIESTNNSSSSLCTPFYVNAFKSNDKLKISWVAPREGSKGNNYKVYRKTVSTGDNSIYKDKEIGTTDRQSFIDENFNDLSDSAYYIYSVIKVGELLYNPALPVFKNAPIGFKPKFTFKHFELEAGAGFNYVGASLNTIYYTQIGLTKIRFNRKFSILPINIRFQSQLNDDLGVAAYSTFEFSKNILALRLGGGVQGIFYNNNEPKFSPVINACLVIRNLTKNQSIKNFGINISTHYSAQYCEFNYSGVFLGISYKFY